MKKFEIIKRGNYMFIQSVSYNNPINNLDLVAKELRKYKYEGNVIFDLLLSTGNTSNRFLVSKFLNKNFDKNSFKKAKISPRVKNEITIYYKDHIEFLKNSILPKSIIQKIVNENYLE